MVIDLVLIGLGITLEPFPVTAFILILGADRGIIKGLAFILGWLACLVVVVAGVMLATGGTPVQKNTAPSTAALAVKLALGLVLIGVAVRQWRRMGRPRKPPAWIARLDRLSPWTAAGLAAFLQPWVLVGAGAATITAARLSTLGDYLALLVFFVLATSSYLAMELYTVFAPAAADARLKRLRTWMDTHRDQVIVALSLLLGLWLVSKSSYLLAMSQ
ncbi:MAG: GAP family protein [Streptosporangiaceae bacterium]